MANQRKTVLITGGCGFLGSHLAETHLKDGYQVICVDNFSTSTQSNASFLNSLGTDKLVIVEADVIEPRSTWADSLPEAGLRTSVTSITLPLPLPLPSTNFWP